MLTVRRIAARAITGARPAAARAASAVRAVSVAARSFEGAARPAPALFAKFPATQSRLFSSAAAPEDSRKIFVGNLAWKVSSEDLHSHFQQWGQIEDARVIMDRENPFRSRGFGFVTFARPEDAETAIKNNHDKEWQYLNEFVAWRLVTGVLAANSRMRL